MASPPALPNTMPKGPVDFQSLLRDSMSGLTDMTRFEAHIHGLVHRRVHQPMQAMHSNVQAFRNALQQAVASPNGPKAIGATQNGSTGARPNGVQTGQAVQGNGNAQKSTLPAGYDYASFRRASAADFNRARLTRPSSPSVDNLLPGHARSLAPTIEQAAQQFGLNPELIVSVIQAESNFNPKAVSKKGAMGLMQLMPDTARAMGAKDPFSAKDNIMAGSKYLKGMQDRFGDRKLALAAYNAGPGTVEKYGGVPPYMETQRYVEKVLANVSAR